MNAPKEYPVVVCAYPPDYPDLFHDWYQPEHVLLLCQNVRLGLVCPLVRWSLRKCLLAPGVFSPLRPRLATATA